MVIDYEARVSLAYEIRLGDGEILDLATEEDPFEFVVGHQDVFPAIEKAIIGREEGDTFEFSVAPEEAFGPHDPDLIRAFPKESFGEDADLKVDEDYKCETEEGLPLSFRVEAIEGGDIVVDFNHPLAGKGLQVKVSILKVS